jgi:hypothetical protein
MQYILITAYVGRRYMRLIFFLLRFAPCATPPTRGGGGCLVFCPIRHLLKFSVRKLRTISKDKEFCPYLFVYTTEMPQLKKKSWERFWKRVWFRSACAARRIWVRVVTSFGIVVTSFGVYEILPINWSYRLRNYIYVRYLRREGSKAGKKADRQTISKAAT